jgi:alpha-D-xyloside xylohydrolase
MEGPRQLTRDFPLDEFPVFAREGAVVPLKVTRDYTGFGDRDSAEFTTWLIYPNGRSEFTLWNPETHPQPEATTVKVESGVVLKIQFSGRKQPHLMRIHTQSKPQSVTLDGQLLAEGEAWQFESASRKLVIKTRNYTEGDYRVSWH